MKIIYILGLFLLLFCFYKKISITQNKLKEQIKEQEDIINNYKINNSKLTYKVKEQENIINNNNLNNTKLAEKLEELEDIINTSKDKIFEKYIKVKNENNKLLAKLKYNKNLDKIKESNNTKNISYEINRDLMLVREENADLKKKIEELENIPNKDFENYKTLDYNPEYIGKQLEFFYDLIINIKSIRELSEKDKGWEIKWNKNINTIKEFIKDNKKLLNVGILGNGNIGKSFLLSRIFK